MSKHTPGPWSLERGPDGFEIGEFGVIWPDTYEEHEADARLVAAQLRRQGAPFRFARNDVDGRNRR